MSGGATGPLSAGVSTRRLLAAVLVAALAGTTLTGMPALAAQTPPDHGSAGFVDQRVRSLGDVDDDPSCTTTQFPGAQALAATPQVQTFVPSRAPLTMVDLCMTTSLDDVPVTVVLRDATTGEEVARTRNARVSKAGLEDSRWRTFTFGGGAVATVPGRTYRLEVGLTESVGTGNVVSWRLTCARQSALDPCVSPTDRYRNGSASSVSLSGATVPLGTNADFGFRTSTAHPADLTVALDRVVDTVSDAATAGHLCPGAGRFEAVVEVGALGNDGGTAPYEVRVLLSGVSDPVGSVRLAQATHHPTTLQVPLTLPASAVTGRATLTAVVDAASEVVETDEDNNTSPGSPVKVTTCDASSFAGMTIEAANSLTQEAIVPAGVTQVPIEAIAHDVPFDAGLGASDLGHLANPETWGFNPETWGFNPETWGFNPETWGFNPETWGFNPYYEANPETWGFNPETWGFNPETWGFNPLAGKPMLTAPARVVSFDPGAPFLDQIGSPTTGLGNEMSFLFGVPTHVLDEIPVTTINLRRARGWTGYFEGSALADEFVQNATLLDALTFEHSPAAYEPPVLIHAELGADEGPLSVFNLGATALGATPLADLPAPHGGWCALADTLADVTGCSESDGGVTLSIATGSTPRPTLLTLDALGLDFTTPAWRDGQAPATLFDLPLDEWQVDGAVRVHPLSPLGFVPLLRPRDTDGNVTGAPLVDPAGTGLADLRVTTQLDPVVDCTAVACDGSTTLQQVALLDAWDDRARFADLVAALPDEELARLTFDDLLRAVQNGEGASSAFENADLDALLLADRVTPGEQTVSYAVRIDAGDGAALVDPVLQLSLPPGFAVIDGSAAISAAGDPGATATAAGVGGSGRSSQVVTVTTDLVLPAGSSATVRFRANPGPVLGAFETTGTGAAHHLSGPDPATVSAGPSGTIEVVEPAEDGELVTLQPGTLHLGHLAQPGAIDVYEIPVPQPALSELRITVSHLPADYDALLSTAATTSMQANPETWGFNPETWGFNPETWGFNPVPSEEIVPENAVVADTTGQVDVVSPQMLDDVPRDPRAFGPPDHRALRAYSIERGAQATERLSVKVIEGETGAFRLQVSGYNQAASSDYYVVHVQVLPQRAADLGACQPLPFTPTVPPDGVGTLPTIDASNQDTRTLFLVPRSRVAGREGLEALQTLDDSLSELAAHPSVQGLVVPIEADPDVDAAFERWDDVASRCDPAVANDVSMEIRDVVMSYASQLPSLRYVVLVGDDTAIPYLRYRDGNTLGNETAFLSSVLMEFGEPFDEAFGTPLTHALRSGTFLTDDHFGTFQVKPWLDQGVFIPSLAVGRLAGDVPTVVAAATHFQASDGLVAPGIVALQDGVGTGYAHNLDGGEQTALALDAALGIETAKLLGDGWSADELRTRIDAALGGGPAALSLNGHADHRRFLAAQGNAAGDNTDSIDVRPSVLNDQQPDLAALPGGTLLFSMGCHVNYDLPIVPGSIRDFSDAVAAGQGFLVANTGFNYGEATTVAGGELFSARFAARLGDDGATVGSAFALAKADAYAIEGGGGWEPLKSMQGTTFMGLPMYRVAGETAGQPEVDVPARTPVPGTQLQVADVVVDFTFDRDPTSPDPSALSGVYSVTDVTVTTGGSPLTVPAHLFDLALDQRPMGPQVVLDVSAWLTGPGEEIRGVVVTDLESHPDLAGYTPTLGNVVVGDAELGDDSESAGIFPLRPAVVRHTPSFGDTQVSALALRPWTYRADDGARSGALRLDHRMRLRVYFGPRDAGREKPTVAYAAPERSGSALGFEVLTLDNGATVNEVSALYRDGGTGTWLYEAGFTTSDGSWWIAAGEFPSSTRPTEVLVTAVTDSGITSLWRNKGDLVSLVPEGVLDFTLTGARSPSGWYTEPVTIVFPRTDTYTVDVRGVESVTFTGTSYTIPYEGELVIDASSSTSSVSGILAPVDLTAPTITVASPVAGTYDYVDRTLTFEHACADELSQVASCTGTLLTSDGPVPIAAGDSLTLEAGTYTYVVEGRDVAGHVATHEVTFVVGPPPYRFEGFYQPVNNGVWNVVGDDEDDGDDHQLRGVPLRWRVLLGSDPVLDPSVVSSVRWEQVTCTTDPQAAEPTGLGLTVSTDGSGITVDDWYGVMRLKVRVPDWDGGNCARLRLQLVDTQVHHAWFKRAQG